jgi:hypothetical protein
MARKHSDFDTSIPGEVRRLREENARLKALLAEHGIA